MSTANAKTMFTLVTDWEEEYDYQFRYKANSKNCLNSLGLVKVDTLDDSEQKLQTIKDPGKSITLSGSPLVDSQRLEMEINPNHQAVALALIEENEKFDNCSGGILKLVILGGKSRSYKAEDGQYISFNLELRPAGRSWIAKAHNKGKTQVIHQLLFQGHGSTSPHGVAKIRTQDTQITSLKAEGTFFKK